MKKKHEQARLELRHWQTSQPSNYYTNNPQIRRLLKRLMGQKKHEEIEEHLAHFGEVIAKKLDRAAIINNQNLNLPKLERWSPIGERIEAIDHHPSYHDCGRAIYEDGRVIAVYKNPSANLYAQALFYLSSHVGEAGHNCPVACTAGVVKALQGVGSAELRDRWLPNLLTNHYEDRLDGAQFLTELQGGSDVGANSVEAQADGEGYGTTRWRIYGEKWFCSNAAADLILMTARKPEGATGTRGLGLFLVPRILENGEVNHIHLRRLKDKLGTRSMASAEIDFNGAIAYAMGDVDSGFKNVMRYVINTSRLYNTLGCAGISRRAYLVADRYARHRRAFGQPIFNFLLVQEMLANMRAVSNVLLAGGLDIAQMADRDERDELEKADQDFLRVATNLVKMRSCQHSHRVVLTGIETLAGNGAIETFSVLPRLLRDNVVYENWEGTHNTLIAQTVRDFGRHQLHRGFLSGLRQRLDTASMPKLLAPVYEAIEHSEQAIDHLRELQDPNTIALMIRPHIERLADVLFAAAYAVDVAAESDSSRREVECAALELFIGHHIVETPMRRDQAYITHIKAVAGLDDEG